MIDIVITLVFSVVMLMFMIFPAMKIVQWLEGQITITKRWHDYLTFGITILLSLSIGLFLRYYPI